MKRIYFFILISLIPIFSFGQKNKTSKDESLAQELVETYFNELWSDFKTSKIKDVCTKDFIFIQNDKIWNTNSIAEYQKDISDKIAIIKRENRVEIIKIERSKNLMWFSYHNYMSWIENDKITDQSHWLQSAVAIKTIHGWKLKTIHSSSVTTDEFLNYYDYSHGWDEIIATQLTPSSSDYIIFNREEGTNTDEKHIINYRLREEKIVIQYKEGAYNIDFFNNGVFKKKVKYGAVDNSFLSSVDFYTAYRVKSAKDSLTVIRYHELGDMNGMSFLAIDNEYNTYYLGTYQGSITCFDDLDGDGDIDFLDIDGTFTHKEEIFEKENTDIYHFDLIELENGKKVNTNPKYDNLAVLECQDSYIITTKRDVENLKTNIKVNPCSQGNESVRKRIEKKLSSVLIEKE